MAEDELTITVRLDDQASAQIAALKQQMSGLGTGQQAAGAERMRRQSRESSEGAAQLTSSLKGMAFQLGAIGGAVGSVVGRITDLGLSFLSRVTDIKAYSNEMVKLQQTAYATGTSTAQLQANIDIFKESGIDPNTARANLAGYSNVLADLRKVNSQTRRDLFAGLRPGQVSDMRAFLDDVLSGDPNEAINKIKDFGEQIRKFVLEQTGSEEAAAQRQQAFYRTFNLPDLDKVRAPFRVVTAEEKQLFKDREANAVRYQTSTERTSIAWERSARSLTAIALHLVPITHGMESMAGVGESIVASLQQWETEFRKTDGSFESFIRVTREWGTGLDNWVGREIVALTRDIEKMATEFAKLPGLVAEFYRVLQAKPQDVIDRLNRKHGPEARTGYEWIQDYMAGKVDFWGNEIPLEQQTKAFDAEALGEQGKAGKPGTPIPEIPPPITPQLPPQAAIPAIPPLTVQPRQQQPTAPGYTPSREPPKIEEIPVPRALPPPSVPTIPLPELPAVPQVKLPTVPQAAAQPQQPLTLAPVTLPAQPAIPASVAAQPAPVIAQPALVPVAAQPAPVVTVPPPAPVVNIAPQPAPLPAVQPAPVSPLIQQPTPTLLDILRANEKAGQPIVLPKPEPPAVVPAPQAAPVIVPPREEKRFSAVQPMPSAFEGGRPIDLAGTGSPTMAAAEKGQTQNWMDFADAGAAIDRASTRDVNVNGTGKISVDVRAPNGTNVKAEGEGLFRKTEITRQTQMELASGGPTQPAGASVAA